MYEEREAARFGNYNWTTWQQLPHEERVLGIAHYRVYKAVEMHKTDAVQMASERANRKR